MSLHMLEGKPESRQWHVAAALNEEQKRMLLVPTASGQEKPTALIINIHELNIILSIFLSLK